MALEYPVVENEIDETDRIAGENACPPEHVGGPHSYFDFLAAIKDPTHKEHNSMLQWIGGSFDPTVFNITDVNERLATIKT